MLVPRRLLAPGIHRIQVFCLRFLVSMSPVVIAFGSAHAAGADPTAAAGSAVQRPFVDSDRVRDPAIGISFSLPAGWQLDAKSDSGDLSLIHPTTGATFYVQLQAKARDLATEFKGLKLAVPFLGGGWSSVGERWTKVGKLKAGELESRRDHADGKTWHEWNLVCVQKSRALLLWFSVPEAEAQARRSDLDHMLASFEWSKK